MHTRCVLEVADENNAVVELEWSSRGVDPPDNLLGEFDSCGCTVAVSQSRRLLFRGCGYGLTVEALSAIYNDIPRCFFVLFQHSLIKLGVVAPSERRSEHPSERAPRVPVNCTQDFEPPGTQLLILIHATDIERSRVHRTTAAAESYAAQLAGGCRCIE